VAQLLWWAQAYLYEGGFGLSIYGYWRVTQRAMQQAHAAETEHVRNEQRVQTARLLALQSRVEPQMLFDALGRVSELHGGDPQVADALLADLIALLRAMQPSAKTDTSTVEREFALVEAWLRATVSVGHEGARVQLQMTPEAPSVGIAPMLVLPLVRAVLALPRAGVCAWLLNARVAGARVVITLQAAAEAGNAPAALADVDLSSLRDRLAELFGQSAQLTMSPRPPSVTLDLPRLQEERDDNDRTDR
jgi:LytS/YehU family sensor histidine kinase